MDLGLKGKVALVAGASRGLGFAVARELAAEGASLSISRAIAQISATKEDANRKERHQAQDQRHFNYLSQQTV